jgi:predicted component of type VI protein secretion system
MSGMMDGDELDSDKRLSMVDEALVAGTIANTNGLLVILAKLVAKGVFDRDDLKSFSDSYSKPLDHSGMRENELVELPSSSAANTRTFAEKARAWSRLAQFCAPAQKDRQ